jgi:predicted ATPase
MPCLATATRCVGTRADTEASLVTAINGVEMLLVVDNCEHLIDR